MNNKIVLVVALALCGCVSSKTTTKPAPATSSMTLGQKMAAAKAAAAAPVSSPDPKLAPKGISAVPKSLGLIVTVTVEPVTPPEPGSFGQRFNCAHPTNVHGFVWFKNQAGLNGQDIWFLPFNATDSATNASSYAPCVTRFGQPPSGKYVPAIYAEFRGSQTTTTTAARSAPDAFTLLREAKRKELGKKAGDYGMTADGKIIKLVP